MLVQERCSLQLFRGLGIEKSVAVMGILNVTPDSFYDGKRYFDANAAVERALAMAEDGADIIDIGGESTRPGAEPVSAEEELRRVMPVLEKVVEKISVPVSIDTYKADVAKRALDAGARIVNDVSALRFDARMVEVVAERGAYVVLMHMRGTPRDMQENPVYDDVVAEVKEFLAERTQFAARNGIDGGKIIIDPGIGFGKKLEHNLELLGRLSEFLELEKPVLVGTSRKSFIGQLVGVPAEERFPGTAASVALAIREGASMVRVHDVREAVQVVRVAEAICSHLPAREKN